MTTIKLDHVSKKLRNTDTSLKSAPKALLGAFDNSSKEAINYLQELDVRTASADREFALDGVNLTIRSGETLSVIGPSGCGKSTLLRVIAGIILPDKGEVLFDGEPLQNIPAADRGIGMVFQSYALFPHLRAEENIGFFDSIRKREDRIPERIRYISEEMDVPIKHLLSKKPPQMSGGERQRVAIAHLLARDPKVFLFDEPLSNLDAKLRASLRVQIKRVINRYQITTVYVTHDQSEAIALGDRIAIMDQGRIEQVGTYQLLHEDPANAFVAGFLGTPSMNFLRGVLRGNYWVGDKFMIGPFREEQRKEVPIVLGIRPEHIQLGSEGTQAQVERVETLYDSRQQIVHLVIGDLRLTALVPLNTRISGYQLVNVSFLVEHIRLFDAETGTRVRL